MVSFEFYQVNYRGGILTADDWSPVEREASARLEKYKRIYKVTGDNTAEKMAVCAMAEVLDYYSGMTDLSSASIGSVSESRASVDVSEKAQEKALYKAASLYLDIYRGCG